MLGRCHFPARRLQLEVTESYVLENPDRARTAIKNLKSLGIAVALDDFGTGYSSIGYLRSFSFDSLKIDKSLAGLVDVDTQAAELVRGTVRIAGALDITVVAEGVENQNSWRCCGGRDATDCRATILANRCPSRRYCSCASSRADRLLGGQRFQLIAKTGHRDGAVIRSPAIFWSSAEL